MQPRAIRGIEEFYAHALAIEREAAERYREFEAWFRDRDEEVLAGLCASIAFMEEEHLRQLLEASRNLSLPALAQGEYQWLESGSPEAAARELFYRVAEPRHLLEIALQAERDALAWFDWAARTAPEDKVRVAAHEMAQEEKRHVLWVKNALDYNVATRVDWERLLAEGKGPGALVGAADATARPRAGKPSRRLR